MTASSPRAAPPLPSADGVWEHLHLAPEALGEGMPALRDAAIERLRELLPAGIVVSGNAERLWNTLAILIPGADSRKLVAALDRAGIEASTGSACSSGAASAARVVAAIAPSLGLAPGAPAGMVRFSAGPDTTAADWQTAMHALAEAVDMSAGASRPPRVDLR